MLHRRASVRGVRPSRNGPVSGCSFPGPFRGAGVPISRNLSRVSGALTDPPFLFSSKGTWGVAGTIRASCRQIRPAWGVVRPSRLLGSFSPPTPARGWKAAQRAGDAAPGVSTAQAGARGEAQLPPPPSPPAAPLPGGGAEPPTGKFSQAGAPAPEPGRNRDKPRWQAPRDSGWRGTRSALRSRRGSRGAPSPGDARCSPSPPRPRPGGEGGGGPAGASPGGAG